MSYPGRLLRLILLVFAAPLVAEPLRVGVSFAIPPYVITHEDRGIELDLLREAFAGSDHVPEFTYLPLERTFRMLEEGKLDAIINVKPGMLNNAHLSQAVITFHSLEDRIVKHYFRRESQACLCPPEWPVCQCGHHASIELVQNRGVTPGAQEVAENPRSRSARLRGARKLKINN